MDYESLAGEFLVAARGSRSQAWLSEKLGYKSNVVYGWESGRRWPTAAEALRAVDVAGISVKDSLLRFYGTARPWLDEIDPTTPEGVALLLEDMRGSTGLSLLARRAGISRYSVSRWLACKTEPRLPDFFRYVDASSLRLIDFLAAFVPPESLPTALPLYRRLEATRKGAGEQPWMPAILHTLELQEYKALPAHPPGWIGHKIGLSPTEEARCLEAMQEAGIVQFTGTHYRPDPLAVDTRGDDPESLRRMKAHWSGVAAQRILSGAPGQFSFNVFSCSKRDFESIRELHLKYFRRMRAIASSSQPAECVVVVNVHLFALTDEG